MGKRVHLLAVLRVNDHVILAAVVRLDIDRHARLDKVRREVMLDDLLDLRERHAVDVDAAERTEADGAVGTHEMLAANLMLNLRHLLTGLRDKFAGVECQYIWS